MNPLNSKTAVSLLSVTGFLATIVFLAACASNAREVKKENPQPFSAGVPVDAFIVKPEFLNEELEIAGTVAPNQEVAIVSELQRKITSIRVKEGNWVNKGALLFQLDDADLQAQLQRLRQQEKLAELNERRLKDLVDHEAAVQQDYDQAYTNLEVLRAEIRQLQVTIEKTRIRAPFSGRIGIIRAYTGALVSPNTVLTNIVDDGVVKLEFAVPEKYARFIPIGSKQSFTIESDSSRHTATISAREASMDKGTRTLLMRALSANPAGRILPGQSAKVKISVSNAENALMIPSNALVPSAQGYSVFVSKQGKASISPVEIGQRDAEQVQIVKGVAKGDTVITSNLLRLMPGAPLAIAQVQ